MIRDLLRDIDGPMRHVVDFYGLQATGRSLFRIFYCGMFLDAVYDMGVGVIVTFLPPDTFRWTDRSRSNVVRLRRPSPDVRRSTGIALAA
ncbi:hypothetical protein SAE02_61530 [Skermanella aerolata]|uniref:Uncharacterized protein n=1 Tax=Skermanella aerolata TaxID=393310 RepID=A0A512DZY8_9PROT|nr:hypothetical protein [Skermanella aerolata]KJB91888.1 hypothetical protein N826_25565 [Skermanella aerolata KACC 11604]GEO42005.1 hypothetical protein SAE02_61530 [Skermanella aerolata]